MQLCHKLEPEFPDLISFQECNDQGGDCDESHARFRHGQHFQGLLHGLKNRSDEVQLMVDFTIDYELSFYRLL